MLDKMFPKDQGNNSMSSKDASQKMRAGHSCCKRWMSCILRKVNPNRTAVTKWENNHGNSFAMHATSKKSPGITSKNQAVICFFRIFPLFFIFKPLLKDPFAEV